MNEGGEQMEAEAKSPPREEWAPPSAVVNVAGAPTTESVTDEAREVVFDVRDLSVFYGSVPAVRGVSLPLNQKEITAIIGPSGCGKTTFLRCLNRMNDLVEGARIEGEVLYHGVNLYEAGIDPVE